MESAKIRELFLEFFQQKGHEILPSSSLLPKDDATLLFTNAGMVQFKSVFLGDDVRPYKRAATVQKCLRAGGKHNDLENVGRTARHHTFFEMLGNFSFGDYFKQEASAWAWEFLTEWVKLPADKLLITVYEKDDQAADIWHSHVGIDESRIFRLGEKDNFWQMGDTGPCGPCSEIHIDQGSEAGCDRPDCQVGCDCDRYLEIWNLVFMQYNRDASGELTPLPKPSIDTGMGLERLAAILQGKLNNFDTDLFTPIIGSVEALSGKQYHRDPATDVSLRVIADHIRSTAFVLADGLTPSNEGRGYVMRRIIRRAARHGFMLGIERPFLYEVLDAVYEMMSGPYPEILDGASMSRKVLKLEEERFAHTLASGMEILNNVMTEVKSSGEETIPGSELFKLYDTYGFPLDLARDIAEDNNLRVDSAGFTAEMEEQKKRARASWTGGEDSIAEVYKQIKDVAGPTEFLGYDAVQADSTVTAIIRAGALADAAGEGDEIEIVLDHSPFYGESGGQVGDMGVIRADNLRVEIRDTKKIGNILVHAGAVMQGTVQKGMTVHGVVDSERRKSIMRNHTATHLLHSALKAVLGDHIKQAGSLVAADRLRFDFNHFFALDDQEVHEVESMVNERIIENDPVHVSQSSLDDALSKGVTALFGEKYGDSVRVVKAGDFSAELCGGTHCHATGEIGPFKIVSEGSVAAGIRRIEAITGTAALQYVNARNEELKRAAALLKVRERDVSGRVEKMLQDLKAYEKELDRVKQKAVSGSVDSILDKAVDVKGIQVLSFRSDGLDMKSLRGLADKLKDKIQSGVIVLGSGLDGQAFYVSSVTKDITDRLHAGDILKAVTGGKGGGRPDMAQGGTKDPAGIEKALASVSDIIKEKIK